MESPGRAHVHERWALRAEGEGLVEHVLNIDAEGPVLVVLIRGKEVSVPNRFQRDWTRGYTHREDVASRSGEVVAPGLAGAATDANPLEGSVGKLIARKEAIQTLVGVV